MKALHFKNLYSKLSFITCLVLFAPSIMANTNDLLPQPQSEPLEHIGGLPTNTVEFIAGPSFSATHNNSQQIMITNAITNTYQYDNKSTTSFIGGISYLHTFNLDTQPLYFSIGAKLLYNHFKPITGIEYPFSNGGSFDTLDYQMRANSVATFYENRLLLILGHWRPYLLAGLGLSVNSLYDYSEKPTDPNGSAAPAASVFRGKTQSSFAFEAGAGINYLLSNKNCGYSACYELGLSYQYTSLGEAQLAPSTMQTTNQTLNISRLAVHAVLFSLGVLW